MQDDPAGFAAPPGAETHVQDTKIFRHSKPQIHRAEFGRQLFETRLVMRREPRLGAYTQQMQVAATDLIVADLIMPRTNGSEPGRKLKKESEYCHSPVIMLTTIPTPRSRSKRWIRAPTPACRNPSGHNTSIRGSGTCSTRPRRLKAAFGGPSRHAGGQHRHRCHRRSLHPPDQQHSRTQRAGGILHRPHRRSYAHQPFEPLSQDQGRIAQPPHEFIRLCRLKRAAGLHGEGTYRINEICYPAGFNSPSYFAKCFPRQFGPSPKDYAKRKLRLAMLLIPIFIMKRTLSVNPGHAPEINLLKRCVRIGWSRAGKFHPADEWSASVRLPFGCGAASVRSPCPSSLRRAGGRR